MKRQVAIYAAIFAFSAAVTGAAAQTASPNSPIPRFSQPASFDARQAPKSARQHSGMVPIAGRRYAIGSPALHPLANKAAMPEHQVDIKPFKIDRTETTNAQFAEYLNALPLKPLG